MASEIVGKSILKTEITNIDSFGVWLIVYDKEYFLSYNDFPWFKEAKIKDITNVKLLNENHLYWPGLDVDLEVNMLENLENYPLVFK